MAHKFGGSLHRFDQRGVFNHLLVWLHIAIAIGVDEANLPWVHSHDLGDLVHLHFKRKGSRCNPEAAHGTTWLAVGGDAICINPYIGNGVRASNVSGMLGYSVRSVPVIGA